MVVSEIKLYELLKSRIGSQEAEAFVEILEKKVDQKFEEAKQTLATKEDLANNKAEIIKWMIILFLPLYLSILGLIVGLVIKK